MHVLWLSAIFCNLDHYPFKKANGCTDFISKPWAKEQFLSKIKEHPFVVNHICYPLLFCTQAKGSKRGLQPVPPE
jgi:hypothetical protein